MDGTGSLNCRFCVLIGLFVVKIYRYIIYKCLQKGYAITKIWEMSRMHILTYAGREEY